MNELEHRKELLIDRIDCHRAVVKREFEILKDSNPLTPILDGVGQVRSLLLLPDGTSLIGGLMSLAGRSVGGLYSLASAGLRLINMMLQRRKGAGGAQRPG